MIATKILIIGLGAVIGGWGTRQLLKLIFRKLEGGYAMLLMLVGAMWVAVWVGNWPNFSPKFDDERRQIPSAER